MIEKQVLELKDQSIEDLMGKIINIPVERISPDLENPREIFDEDDIKDLGSNMKRIGQLDEITVFPKEGSEGKWTGDFDLHDGERRWRAANLVGIPFLRAKVIERPTRQELLFKRISRILQTRGLNPEKKVAAVEKSLKELGAWERPETWESYRERLGGGPEWPQIIRILKSRPFIRQMLDQGLINFTLAQSISRLPPNKQEEAAKYIVLNKISGRFFSTQMVPYLLETPDASLAQAFEYTRVAGWRQYTKSPYKRGEEPPVDERLEDFLEACVGWERAWEVLVHTGLLFEISGNDNYQARMKEAGQRILERVLAMLDKLDLIRRSDVDNTGMLSDQKLIGDNQEQDSNID